YWVDRPTGRGPGMFLTVDGTRGADAGRIAEPGEHTDEIFDTIGERRTRSDLRRVVAAGSIPGGLPFAGLRVADFSWIGVGPITAKCLADHGATVVRVESVNRIDGLRVQPPFKDGVFGVNRSNFFGAFNTSKMGLSLDLKTDGGIAAARRLVEWADVVIDSFTPGVMAGLGLGPDDIRQVNPRAITVTTSLLGSGGPRSAMAGYGYHAAALAGFFNLVGYPDGPPEGPWLAYTDTIAPRFITPTILAALDRRARTGSGCHIEAAQLEIALQLLAPELLAFADHGAVAMRAGSRDARFAPQGVYPCEGHDCWAAITVSDDAEWHRFCHVLGRTDWAGDPGLGSLAGRQERHDEIDAGIAAWTSRRSEAEVEAALAEVGVPAAKVQRSSDLAADPQYQHRGFYRSLPHSELGLIPYAGHQYRISGYPLSGRDDANQGSPNGPRSGAPLLGEHTFQVLTDLLGFEMDEVAEIASSGALE
ncbi:MAG: CoA transferase, partial [Actinomycetota bacterium]|nr:CoA transferase [Actinomycetota bacterium]